MKKVLPKNTVISTYFDYKGRTFEKMDLPDRRVLIQRAHHWEDGELMEFGFQYKDGISRKGINPLHIVGIYRSDTYENVLDLKHCPEIEKFLDNYEASFTCTREA